MEEARKWLIDVRTAARRDERNEPNEKEKRKPEGA